jgi:hypothetical protein
VDRAAAVEREGDHHRWGDARQYRRGPVTEPLLVGLWQMQHPGPGREERRV